MKQAAIILAEGFEEIEAISVADILRRGDVDVKIVGLESGIITGAHGITMGADAIFESVNFAALDLIVLPGGLPGATNLAKSAKLQAKLKQMKSAGKTIAAICAAPWALEAAGVLGKKYTCYPGCESKLGEGYDASANVVKDGNIVTSKCPATAMEFALALLEKLEGKEKAKEVKNGLEGNVF